jgi:hypothetical protein
LLKAFEAATDPATHEVAKEAIDVARMIALGHVSYVQGIQEALGFLDSHLEVIEVAGVSGFMLREDAPEGAKAYVTKGLDIIRDRQEVKAAWLMMNDDRGTGLMLYRYADHPRVDFSRLEGKEGIVFAHKGGFIAKTEARDFDIGVEFLKASLI